MNWVKKSQKEIKERIFSSLKKNVNYQEESIIGLPASYLDEKVFSQDKFNLTDAPFLYSLLSNPNHIGCHTIGESESYFNDRNEDGKWTNWYENGQVHSEGCSKDGQWDGKHTYWYESGQKEAEIIYKNGTREEENQWIEDGELQ